MQCSLRHNPVTMNVTEIDHMIVGYHCPSCNYRLVQCHGIQGNVTNPLVEHDAVPMIPLPNIPSKEEYLDITYHCLKCGRFL
jgi:DNA-directed RNA polymerase subunit RPC12/RpoP